VRFPPRLGLRAQIVLSLSLVFALSFWLAGFTALQLSRRSIAIERARSAELLASTLVGMAEAGALGDGRSHDALCARLKSRVPIFALRMSTRRAVSFECGAPRGEPTVRKKFGNDRTVSLWMSPMGSSARPPLIDMLFFYLALTGLAVLLLSYIALTYLIVRPLERLTLSAEELRAGGEHVFVREQGSAEAVRLAQTFNEMATLLRAERKRLVDRLAELERTTDELEHKEQQLIHGEKLASIGRLAAGVAHEIGNPLSAILGLVELLRGGGLSEAESREFLERVHRETERIHRIIGDLLDFARRDVDDDAGAQSADLGEVVDDAVRLLRPQRASRDVQIVVSIDPRTPRVRGPQHRLSQVVLNLVLNALDALAGKGRVDVRAFPSDDGQSVVFVVEDDGPGIAADMLDKLFDPFTTTKPTGQGTGLGLAVTHSIVHGLSGSISVRNKPQGGALFEVRLRSAERASG
jgi:two-component system, NtrC family, sensor kinase